MKKKNFTESKILSIIKQYEGGRAIDGLCRENSISKATVYNWRKKYSGMDG
jgi:putative transposase